MKDINDIEGLEIKSQEENDTIKIIKALKDIAFDSEHIEIKSELSLKEAVIFSQCYLLSDMFKLDKVKTFIQDLLKFRLSNKRKLREELTKLLSSVSQEVAEESGKDNFPTKLL